MSERTYNRFMTLAAVVIYGGSIAAIGSALVNLIP